MHNDTCFILTINFYHIQRYCIIAFFIYFRIGEPRWESTDVRQRGRGRGRGRGRQVSHDETVNEDETVVETESQMDTEDTAL